MPSIPAWSWIAYGLLMLLPVSSALLGIPFVGFAMVLGVGGLWWIAPHHGPIAYTAMWVNLVGYRAMLGNQIRREAPLIAANQNGISAMLMLLGLAGAIGCHFSHDPFGRAAGAVGAVLLFMVQGPLFHPAGMEPWKDSSRLPGM